MWEIILIAFVAIFSVAWILLPVEDEIRAFFDWDK